MKRAGATAIAITGTQVVSATPCILVGYSLRNTFAGAANYNIFDDPDSANGTRLIMLHFTMQNESTGAVAIPGGVHAENGLYLESGGAIEGSVWILPLWD